MMTIDFSCDSFSVETLCTEHDWQKEIVDFICEYQSQENITAQTSGSTGTPKKIILPKKAMQQSAQLTGNFLNLQKGDSALLCLPVHYIAGKMMVVRAIELGLKLICIEPKSVVSVEQNIDFAALTPMQAEKSLASLHYLNKVILGGAPVSTALEKELKSYPSTFYETYGMTETITHIALRKLNSDTYFTALEQMKLSLDDRGCLRIQTPYFSDAIQTNDVVELKGNQFRWLGRADHIINSGGIKINPEEIENILRPFIDSAFVVMGKSDALLGEKLVLIIEGEEQDINYPSSILPKHKTPKEVFFLDLFPRTLSGKIQRNELKKRLGLI